MQKIGVVGLGIMGSGILKNFLKHGYQVFVWNRTRDKVAALEAEGAVVCSTPKELTQKSDIIFEVTANDESSRSVWLGEEGILAGATGEKVLIASATLSVSWVDELATACVNQKHTFFDMPMTGGRVAAESGTLILLCGGDENKLEAIKPILAAIAAKTIYFGPAGQGMRYKLILNFLQAVHIVGFGEAMRMAKNQNMNLQKVSEALAERPGGVITGIAQKAYFEAPDPITFSVEWITKDLSYAFKMAMGKDNNLLNKVYELYKQAMENGLAQKDWMSINKL